MGCPPLDRATYSSWSAAYSKYYKKLWMLWQFSLSNAMRMKMKMDWNNATKQEVLSTFFMLLSCLTSGAITNKL